MKLNLWQWLGVLLLLIGVALYAWRNWGRSDSAAPGGALPATQPAAR